MPTSKTLKSSWQSAFWDASAIVPLCCQQPTTSAANQTFRLFPKMVVWWATRVECTSALNRLEREQQLTTQEHQQAVRFLDKYCSFWTEITPILAYLGQQESPSTTEALPRHS